MKKTSMLTGMAAAAIAATASTAHAGWFTNLKTFLNENHKANQAAEAAAEAERAANAAHY